MTFKCFQGSGQAEVLILAAAMLISAALVYESCSDDNDETSTTQPTVEATE